MAKSKITLETIKSIIVKLKKGQDGKPIYSNDFKKTVIEFHYLSGLHFGVISKETGITVSYLYDWKRHFGSGQTGFVHGKRVRFDVRTKALAVREVIEKGRTHASVAEEFNTSTNSISNWLNLYSEKYNQYIDAPDGIPYIVKDNKMIYGKSNIEKIRAVLQAQHAELISLIEIMHMTGDQAELMAKVAEMTLAKEQELIDAAQILQENGIDLQ